MAMLNFFENNQLKSYFFFQMFYQIIYSNMTVCSLYTSESNIEKNQTEFGYLHCPWRYRDGYIFAGHRAEIVVINVFDKKKKTKLKYDRNSDKNYK